MAFELFMSNQRAKLSLVRKTRRPLRKCPPFLRFLNGSFVVDVQDSKTPCAFVASCILQVLRRLTAESQVTTYRRSISGVGIVKLAGRSRFGS
jgi:hypothetical protein